MPVYKNKDFLNKIMQIESSGGKNVNHPVVTAPNLQQGDQAVGRYALMPNTVKELVNRRRLRGTVSPEMLDLTQMAPDQLKQHLATNPELEEQLANDLSTHVIRKQGGDEDKAAYSWIQGHNLNPNQITPDTLNKSDYVQKFRRVSEALKDKKQNNEEDQEDNND